ncbi:hypothetical protein F5X96DRAFT_663395 [Biscogniauxia mediterranea]|nr:hypothetical protein F5X96DRAFT_663395 [Biscogniauxia mediterranea]
MGHYQHYPFLFVRITCLTLVASLLKCICRSIFVEREVRKSFTRAMLASQLNYLIWQFCRTARGEKAGPQTDNGQTGEALSHLICCIYNVIWI